MTSGRCDEKLQMSDLKLDFGTSCPKFSTLTKVSFAVTLAEVDLEPFKTTNPLHSILQDNQ